MRAKSPFSVYAVFLVALLFSTSLSASQVFTFNYSIPGESSFSGSGTLTTSDLDSVTNTYLIQSITGTRTTSDPFFGTVTMNITGLVPPGGFGNNNLLYKNAPFLDLMGLAFTVDNAALSNDGLGNVAIYFDAGVPGYTENVQAAGYGSFTVAQVVTPPVDPPPANGIPEPSTFALIGAGLVAVAAVRRVRRG